MVYLPGVKDKLWWAAALFVALSALVACASQVQEIVSPSSPAPLPPSSPTATLPPTWTPTPTVTATPVPPAQLEVAWPPRISPLTPMPVEAVLRGPLDVVRAIPWITATVMDPQAAVYASFELARYSGGHYRARDSLQLPLEPLPGYWFLIFHIGAGSAVVGPRAFPFQAEPVAFRDLSDVLPEGVASLRVPVAFREVVVRGDRWAGGRVWAYDRGEIALWWAPGPTELMSSDNALVMLEATYASDPRGIPKPNVTEGVAAKWQEATAYEFLEAWPEPEGGPGHAWVIQGPDFWLYVLRVRAVGQDTLPRLCNEVAQTFRLMGKED